MLFRKCYNNHCASNTYLSSIKEKFSINILNSYSITLPCWTHSFVTGLFLFDLGYATHDYNVKVKGRQDDDPSSLLLDPNNYGSLNLHTDRQDSDVLPWVHYQYALQRLWHRLYNIRLSYLD